MSDKTAEPSDDNPSYIDSLLAYLGDRDPLDAFAETPDALRAATTGLSDTQLQTPEAPDKWSVLNVVQHLGHTELAVGLRYRLVLSEEAPALQAMDQDHWVDALYPDDVSLEEALEDFATLRVVNLRLLRRVTGSQWQRHGIHNERGKETLAFMVRLYAAHDGYHLHQIQRILDAQG